MKRAGKRIIGIGIFHTFLYGYLVPFVIYPRFGDNGLTFAIRIFLNWMTTRRRCLKNLTP